MGRLSTHILDTTAGRPAAGVRVELMQHHHDHWHLVATAHTNADGRTDQPLLAGEVFEAGEYQIEFHIGAYFASLGSVASFLTVVPVRFTIVDASAHYHVPLLCSPWSYSTYRGS